MSRLLLAACFVLLAADPTPAQTPLEAAAAGLVDRDPELRELAAHDLIVFGREAVGPLRRALADAEPNVRAAAARALGRIGVDAAPAAAALGALLAHADATVRRASGPASAELAKLCDDPSLLVRAKAAGLLLSADPRQTRATETLAALLGEPHGRAEAVAAIADARSDARPLAPALAEMIRGSEGDARLVAVNAAGSLGHAAAPLVPLFAAEAKQGADKARREAAVHALERLGAAAAPAAAELALCLDDTTSGLHGHAARALVNSGLAAVPALVAALTRPGGGFGRMMAAGCLRDLGPAARPAGAALRLALRDDKYSLARSYSAQALGQAFAAAGPGAGRDAAAAALAGALGDGEPDVRAAAAEALGELGPDPRSAAALSPLLRDARVGPFAATALARTDPARAPEAIKALVAFLKDPETNVRSRAAVGLGRLGSDAKGAAPALAAALGDRANEVSWMPAMSAAFALMRIDPAPGGPGLKWAAEFHASRRAGGSESEVEAEVKRIGGALTPALLRGLAAPDPATRAFAVAALPWAATPAEAARGLAPLLASPDVRLRSLAAAGLGQLGASAAGALPALRKFQATPSEAQAAAAEAVRLITAALDAVEIA